MAIHHVFASSHIAIQAKSTFLGIALSVRGVLIIKQWIILAIQTHNSIHKAVTIGHVRSVRILNKKYIIHHPQAAKLANKTPFDDIPECNALTFSHKTIAQAIINIIAHHSKNQTVSQRMIKERIIVTTFDVSAIGHNTHTSQNCRLL